MRDYRLGLYEKAMPNALALREKLEGARLAGFDYLELSIDESGEKQSRLNWGQEERRALRRAIEETGMPVDTICLSGHRKWPLGSRDAGTRARGEAMLRKAVDLAHDLGVRIIQLAGYDVYYETGGADTRALFARGLEAGVRYAAAKGVLLGFETMETPFMDTVSKAMEYVRAAASPYLGVYPDLGNLTNAARLYGLDVLEELRAARGHIFSLHIKETEPGRYRNMKFGRGQVDFAAGIACARALGVRCFVAECWHQDGENWREEIARVHDFVRARFA